ncbi:glycosyltransferase [Kocuria rhizophila]|uniref:glycosyltransferase n=1 Tax=Kocuria rhizophila TaxID=72000 RepID=UPI00119F1660|nr:glycosyltransferase [Kocuria rhizophila]
MKHLMAAREARSVDGGTVRAELLAQRAAGAVAHYATEGFRLEARHGEVVPYLHPDQPDFVDLLAGVAVPERMVALEALAERLPESFGSRMLRVSDHRIGVVGSLQIARLLSGTADVERIDPLAEDLDLAALHVLVIALPLVGREQPFTADELADLTHRLLPVARESGVPTVGITLSDPWRTNATRKIATHVDWLLTTDPKGPDTYGKHMRRENRVRVVASHINPHVHSPAGRNRHREQAALFIGQLPETSQPERLRALRAILTGLRRQDFPLTVANSAIFSGTREKSRGVFPSEFFNHLTHSPRETVAPRVTRLFDLHVLAHLQPGSGHAHPLETLEALASGSACMSTYSVAMNNDFPHVLLPDGAEDAALEAAVLAEDPGHLHELQMEGVRRAFAERTADRLTSALLRELDLLDSPRKWLVAWRANPEGTDLELFSSQVVAPDIELRRIAADDEVPEGTAVEIKVGSTVEGRHHLAQDLVNAFRMASVPRVCMNASRPATESFEILPTGRHHEEDVVATWVGEGPAENDGMFVMDPTALRCPPPQQEAPRPKLLSVVVPVYNNGPFLLRKCLESLRRSSVFHDMDIILVDDGSTSAETRAMVRELGRNWPNVRTHLFPVGGSGSASRPRNKGLEMVQTPWVTYLDPDNEAVGDGYAHLLGLCTKHGVDFAIGDMLRYAKTRTVAKNVGTLRGVIVTDTDGVGEVPVDALQRINFQPMSIQALVADTQWLTSLGLEQPIGALGQDSLFFQQMLSRARTVALLDEPVHTYYGEVAGSMVNTVTPTFFRKYLPLEAARSEWLREHGLFDEYVQRRMRRYVTVWFLPKFNNAVAAEDKSEAFAILAELCATYGLHVKLKEDGLTAELAH